MPSPEAERVARWVGIDLMPLGRGQIVGCLQQAGTKRHGLGVGARWVVEIRQIWGRRMRSSQRRTAPVNMLANPAQQVLALGGCRCPNGLKSRRQARLRALHRRTGHRCFGSAWKWRNAVCRRWNFGGLGGMTHAQLVKARRATDWAARCGGVEVTLRGRRAAAPGATLNAADLGAVTN